MRLIWMVGVVEGGDVVEVEKGRCRAIRSAVSSNLGVDAPGAAADGKSMTCNVCVFFCDVQQNLGAAA
jgi:hypothetical protein